MLCFSGRPLLGDFSVTSGSFGGKSRLEFVGSVKKSLLEVSVWAVMAWACRTEIRKMVACKFFIALTGGEGWFFPFAATVGFSGWVVKHGSTDECASYNIGIWTWLRC